MCMRPRVKMRGLLAWQRDNPRGHRDDERVHIERKRIEFDSPIAQWRDRDRVAIGPTPSRNIVQFKRVLAKSLRRAGPRRNERRRKCERQAITQLQ